MLSALAAAGAIALFVVLRRGSGGGATAQRQLDAGRFRSVLDTAAARDAGAGAQPVERDELIATAIAAKHLLELPMARGLLERLLADDPTDGEAWLELGLVEAYDHRLEEAARAFDRVAATRSDLSESLTLHRAWLAILAGDEIGAQRLFGEIEVPLETKLRQDLGQGDPAFAEWFLQAGLLWRRRADETRAEWALAAAREAAPESSLIQTLATS